MGGMTNVEVIHILGSTSNNSDAHVLPPVLPVLVEYHSTVNSDQGILSCTGTYPGFFQGTIFFMGVTLVYNKINLKIKSKCSI